MQPETREQSFARLTNRALAKMGTTNLPFAVELLERRRNQGRRASSNHHFAANMIRLDRHLGGKAFKDASPAELKAFIDALREAARSASTLRNAAIHVGLIMKEALGAEETKDIPRAYRQAYQVPRAKPGVRGAIIPEGAFLAAIEAVPQLGYTCPGVASTQLIRALLWTLWDAGFRISELLSLRINDVTWDDTTGTAKLQLREELAASHGLKTGARYVIIRDAVPALKEWLAIHPGRSHGESPLITSLQYYRNGVRSLNVDSANIVIKRLFGLVGSKPSGSRKKYSAHDFRHTAATRDANNGYREPALRLKYGWSGQSPMPSHYVHMSEEDARQRVLATRPTGAPVQAVDLVNQLAAQLAAAMAAHQAGRGHDGATPAPVITTGGMPPGGAAPAKAVA